MLDKVLAIFALLALFAFCFVLIYWVQRTNLTVVILIGLGLVSYDFWRELSGKKGR